MIQYVKYRSEFKTGDILQWASESIIGRIIRKFSKGPADRSHTSLVVDVNKYNRKFQLEALAAGISLTSIRTRLNDFKGAVYWCPLKPDYDEYRDKIGEIAFSKVGTKYDYKSLFTQAAARVSVDAQKFFCSEYAYWVTKEAGVIIPFDTKYAPKPADMESLGIYLPAIKIFEVSQ